MDWLRFAAALPLLVTGALTGCGDDGGKPSAVASSPIDFLPGERVGRLAEEQLEAEHLTMAPGTITCPDLDWQLRASVRCLRISELSDGRRVKVPGTVTVTDTDGGGRLHVELDDRASEFGVDAAHLSSQAETWVEEQVASAQSVTCPYLVGKIGTVERCAATVTDHEYGVLVTVTAVEPDDYRTRYHFAWESAAPGSKASPTFVATEAPAVVD